MALLPCGNRGVHPNDKCDGIAMYEYNLTHNASYVYEPSGVKVNGKLLSTIDEPFAALLTDAQICGYLKAFHNIDAASINDWDNKATKDAKNALIQADKYVCKYLKAATCAERLDDTSPSFDPALKAEFDACVSPRAWSNRSCQCYTPSNNNQVVDEPEEIYGCLDPTADNYWCKKNLGECVDDKPPTGIKEISCEYSIRVDLKNDYNFCNNKFGCYPDDAPYSIDAPYEVIKYKNDGSLPAGHFESISAATKQVIETINKKIIEKRNGFLFLKSAKGVYTTGVWPSELVDDFAKALAVAELKTKNDDKDDTFPFQRVTIFNPASEIIGQFSIYHGTDRNGETDGITELKNHTSTSTLNYRLQFEIGTPLLYPEDEARTNKALKDDMNIIKYTVVDGKIAKVSVNEEKVGLINILKEEPIGLVKLLK